jgi:hypothetical protein
MKTSLHLSEPLARSVREYLIKHGITFRALCEAALQDFLNRKKGKNRSFKFSATLSNSKPTDIFLQSSWEDIRKSIYEGRGE